MLTLQNLTKNFETLSYPALNDLSLTIKKGEFCIILGANGSGKSTLLKAISGELPLDRGQVDFTQPKSLPAFSVVSQDIHVSTIPEFTFLENLVLSTVHAQPLSRFKNKMKHFAQKLHHFDPMFQRFLPQKMATLSGGQRQCCAIVMALLSERPYLLMDEPMSALSPVMHEKMMALIAKTVLEKNITTLLITHHLNDAIRYGSRIIILHQGNIVRDIQGQEKQHLTLAALQQILLQIETKNSEVYHAA